MTKKKEQSSDQVSVRELEVFISILDKCRATAEMLRKHAESIGIESVRIDYRPSMRRAIEALSRFEPKMSEAAFEVARGEQTGKKN